MRGSLTPREDKTTNTRCTYTYIHIISQKIGHQMRKKNSTLLQCIKMFYCIISYLNLWILEWNISQFLTGLRFIHISAVCYQKTFKYCWICKYSIIKQFLSKLTWYLNWSGFIPERETVFFHSISATIFSLPWRSVAPPLALRAAILSLSLWNGDAVWIISLRETLASHNPTLHSWLCRAGDAGCRQGLPSQNTLRPSFLSQWRLLPRRPLEVLISANQMENMWAMSVPTDGNLKLKRDCAVYGFNLDSNEMSLICNV